MSSRKGVKSGTKENVTQAQRNEMMKQIVSDKKQLTSLKAQVTKAEKAYNSAQGMLLMAQNAKVEAEARHKVSKTLDALFAAQNKYNAAEVALDALVKRYQS